MDAIDSQVTILNEKLKKLGGKFEIIADYVPEENAVALFVHINTSSTDDHYIEVKFIDPSSDYDIFSISSDSGYIEILKVIKEYLIKNKNENNKRATN